MLRKLTDIHFWSEFKDIFSDYIFFQTMVNFKKVKTDASPDIKMTFQIFKNIIGTYRVERVFPFIEISFQT